MDYVVKQMLKPRPVAIKTAISISATGNHWCWENGEEALSAGFPHVSLQSGLKHACRSCWERRAHICTAAHENTHLLADFHTLAHAVSPDPVASGCNGGRGGFPGAVRVGQRENN